MPAGEATFSQVSSPLHQNRVRCNDAGFTYLAMLCAMALLALAASGVVTVLAQQAQREREERLLEMGQVFVQAIASYYQKTPGAVKRLPEKLEDLLNDKRMVGITRHLRTIYADPMTQRADWGLVRGAGGGIKGVRSRSDRAPIRTGTVELTWAGPGTGMDASNSLTLLPASRYSDWLFVYEPAVASAGKVR